MKAEFLPPTLYSIQTFHLQVTTDAGAFQIFLIRNTFSRAKFERKLSLSELAASTVVGPPAKFRDPSTD